MAAAGLAAAVGALWLMCWLSGSSALLAMASARCKANTALGLTLMGSGYVMLLAHYRRRWLTATSISIATSIGALTLLEYAGLGDLGIDQLLAPDAMPDEAAQFPNRMSPLAAANFCLIGVSAWLLTRHSRAATRIGHTTTLLALSIASVALIGHVYSASILYRPLPYLRLSPYTAAAQLLLVGAAFALRPDVGLGRALTSNSIGGYLARRLLPITVLLPLLVGWLLLDTHESPLTLAESHALMATAVAAVMAPTVLFLALSLDRIEGDRVKAEEFLRSASELTAALSRARTVSEVVNATLDLGLPALGARAGAFMRLSADGRELEAVGTRGYQSGALDGYEKISVDAPFPAALAVSRREAVFLGSAAEGDKRFPRMPELNLHGSWAALPLEGHHGPLGAIALSFEAGQRFSRLTRERARQLAWQCAQALDRALLFDSEQRAREQAESASRAKDEFLAMLGHELRNPLSPILTSLHLMELRDPKESTREREVIKRQVSHMVRLVDDLLDVSRIASGRVELRKRVQEMSQIINSALELVTPLMQQRQHQVVVEVPARGLQVDADHGRMVQVISNLLTNAAKYSSVGSRIVVRADRDGSDVVTQVIDNGAGISIELLPSVFELFVQGARTLERSQGGLGLGLSLVRSLVELHGGSVSAHSDGSGHGSVFTVRLPGALAIVSDVAPVATKFPQRVGAPLRVLLVDDNRDAADSMAQALSEAGHEVQVAYDGPSALIAAQSFEPRLALLDIGLPVMSGYELARQLRRQRSKSELTLVAVTGYGQAADRERSKAVGFDEHLVKPVSVIDLMTLLADLAPSPTRQVGSQPEQASG
jgi:signal transduction histidine kinase/ActR/RegA family two-component response regulator